MDKKTAVRHETIRRELESRNKDKQDDLLKFMQHYYKEERPKGISELLVDDYMYILSNALMEVVEKKTTRLIINIPPWHTKTEFVTKFLPAWAMGKDPTLQIITTWYSTQLTQWFSQETKEIYESDTYKRVFPRRPDLSATQNTKEHWKTENWWAYYATWCWWTITWKRCNLFLIDDPCKPDEAWSDVVRTGINNWFENTVVSRLFNPLEDCIIIIMQRIHTDDLCWHLIEKMDWWHWEKYKIINLPAIATEEEVFQTRYWKITRKEGEPLAPQRFPIPALDLIKQSQWRVNFSCQYQQNPIDSEAAEFHRQWFKYYDSAPAVWRTFIAVDLAFSKKTTADNSCIMVVKFFEDKLYILECIAWKFDPWELIDLMIQQIRKWNPEKIWIEAVQWQVIMWFNLRIALEKKWLHCPVEDITQRWDKETKIRRLIPLYRNWLIYHKREWLYWLEKELLEFPRSRNDDQADTLQMVYELYDLQPWNQKIHKVPVVKYDSSWRPYF